MEKSSPFVEHYVSGTSQKKKGQPVKASPKISCWIKILRAFNQNDQISEEALKTVKNSSLYLTDVQREQVGNLQSSMMVLDQASSGLTDSFTLGFAEAFNSFDELTKAMESLAQVMEGLGRASADVLNSFVRLLGWLSHILPSVGGDGTAAGIKESYTGSRDMTPKSEQPEKGFWENCLILTLKISSRRSTAVRPQMCQNLNRSRITSQR